MGKAEKTEDRVVGVVGMLIAIAILVWAFIAPFWVSSLRNDNKQLAKVANAAAERIVELEKQLAMGKWPIVEAKKMGAGPSGGTEMWKFDVSIDTVLWTRSYEAFMRQHPELHTVIIRSGITTGTNEVFTLVEVMVVKKYD